MNYRRFRLPEIDPTLATARPTSRTSVANVASVAGAESKSGYAVTAQNVASVANVAGRKLESDRSNPPRSFSENSFDLATLATLATVQRLEQASVATVANVAEPESETATFAADVLVLFEAAAMRLASLGRSRLDAEREAILVVRGELRNDPRLTPEQPDPYRCLICGQGDIPGRALVPVLTPVPDHPVWLHLEPCHAEHCRRQTDKVDACLRASGIEAHGPGAGVG